MRSTGPTSPAHARRHRELLAYLQRRPREMRLGVVSFFTGRGDDMRMRTGACVIGLAAVLTSADPAAARAVDLRNVLDEYSLRRGAPRTASPPAKCWPSPRTRDGFLWLGTNGGLVRFDGTRFILPSRARASMALGPSAGHRPGRRSVGRARRDRRRAAIPIEAAAGLADSSSEHGPASGLAAARRARWSRTSTAGCGWGIWAGCSATTPGRGRVVAARGTEQPEVHCLAVDGAAGCSSGPATASSGRRAPDHQRFETLDGRPVATTRWSASASIPAAACGVPTACTASRGVSARRPPCRRDRARQRLLHDRAGHLWVGTGGQGLWRVSCAPTAGCSSSSRR